MIERVRLRSRRVSKSSDFMALLLPAVVQPPAWPGLARMHVEPQGVHQDLEPSNPGNDELSSFWKCTVFTDDLDLLRTTLVDAGIEVTQPLQFGDIGYLCHFDEPGGNAIELLQRTFVDSQRPAEATPHTLGLITLRITDPDASHAFYVDGLGMKLLCTMAVDDGRPDPFDLYFYASTDERPPDPEPAAVINREWLYQRRYSIIELQHYRAPTPGLRSITDGDEHGLIEIELSTSDIANVTDRLHQAGITFAGTTDADPSANAVHFESPDGHPFVCRSI